MAARQHYAPPATSCERHGDTLHVAGDTDTAMLACFTANADAERVKITSPGGDVDAALAIGEIFAGMNADLVVVEQCSSSCSNFLLPVARSVTISADDLLLTHGGIDPAFALKFGRPLYDGLVRDQYDFAQRHAVPPGWLLYRTADDAETGLTRFATAPKTTKRDGTVRFFHMGEAFIRSCLPKLDLRVEPAPDGRPDAADALDAFDAIPTGPMRCTPDQSWPALPPTPET